MQGASLSSCCSADNAWHRRVVTESGGDVQWTPAMARTWATRRAGPEDLDRPRGNHGRRAPEHGRRACRSREDSDPMCRPAPPRSACSARSASYLVAVLLNLALVDAFLRAEDGRPPPPGAHHRRRPSLPRREARPPGRWYRRVSRFARIALTEEAEGQIGRNYARVRGTPAAAMPVGRGVSALEEPRPPATERLDEAEENGALSSQGRCETFR